MPVKLEHITQPSDADWIDIEKIHKETSNSGLTSAPMQISEHLTQGGWIVAARFNDRIIGVLLAQQQQNQVVIREAAVRTITQRRGVMHQTLFLLMKWAQEQKLTLVCRNVPVALQAPLSRRGFREQDQVWVCE